REPVVLLPGPETSPGKRHSVNCVEPKKYFATGCTRYNRPATPAPRNRPPKWRSRSAVTAQRFPGRKGIVAIVGIVASRKRFATGCTGYNRLLEGVGPGRVPGLGPNHGPSGCARLQTVAKRILIVQGDLQIRSRAVQGMPLSCGTGQEKSGTVFDA